MGVENKLEPYKTVSCVRLNQLILEVDRENGGKRYDVANVRPEGARAADPDRLVGCRRTLNVNENGEQELVVTCDSHSTLPKVLAEIVELTERGSARSS